MGAIGRPDGDDAAGRVAYQGAPGLLQPRRLHRRCGPGTIHVPFDTFAEAIEAVRSGDCDCALIPVENSTIGVVEPAATLVREAGLDVVAEVWRPIRLALMAIETARRLADIRTVESHPVALRQCAGTLEALKLTAGRGLRHRRRRPRRGRGRRSRPAPPSPRWVRPRSMACRFCATTFRIPPKTHTFCADLSAKGLTAHDRCVS